MRAAVLVLLASLLFVACQRPSTELCERGCWNFYSLKFWEKAEADIAAAPEAEREALRAAKQAELDEVRANEEHPQHGHFQICMESCRKSGRQPVIECYANAGAASELDACSE